MNAVFKARKKKRVGGEGGYLKDVRDPLLLSECAFVTPRRVGHSPTMEFCCMFGIFHRGIGNL